MRHVKGNYYEIPKIKFHYHGEWSDPEIEYMKRLFNIHPIEDSYWAEFERENPDLTEFELEEKFPEFMFENAENIYCELNDLISNGFGAISNY